MTDTVCQTERLILRRFREDDVPHWLEHMNTPRVRAHLGGVKPADEVAARVKRVRSKWNDRTGGYLALIRREDGAFLGEVGCGEMANDAAPEELRGELELGWQLRDDCWGQGYVTEAANAVLELVFGRFERALVYAQTSEANRGSWRVMERLGMERVPTLDYDDPGYPPEENPTKVYRLTHAQWQARNG